MNYRELLAGVNNYNEKKPIRDFPKTPYLEDEDSVESYYYEALDKNRDIIERTRLIVNKWGKCMVPIDDRKLRGAVGKFKKNHGATLDWKLSEISLWKYHDEIVDIFNLFTDFASNRKKQYTGASKVLHILNPKFFMMWDDSIRYEYGCSESKEGYFNFLARSQREIKEILETYAEDYGKIDNMSHRIYSGRGRNKTIVKLLDEYNWTIIKK